MVSERAVVGQLVLDEPVEVEARRGVALRIGRSIVIGLSAQGKFRRAVLVVDRSVERTAERGLERKPLADVIPEEGTAGHRHAVDHLRLQRSQRHGVQDLVVLVVCTNTPITVTLEVKRTILIIDGPDRARCQRRLHDASAVVIPRGIYLVRLRIGGREIHAVLEILVLAVEVHAEGVALEVGVDDDALLVVIVPRNEIIDVLAFARNGNVVARGRGRAEDGILPVGVGQARFSVQIGNQLHGVIHIRFGAISVRSRTARILIEIGRIVRLLRDLGILVGIHQVDLFRNLLDAVVAVVGHLDGLRFPLLGRDEDHAVRTARTVNRGRRGVLQHLHRLDVVRIEVREAVLHRHAVDDIQRVVAGRGRADTAHAHHHVAFGIAARLHHLHTGHLAGHRLPEVGDRTVGDILGLDRRDGRRDVALLHGTVTDHHYVVQRRGLLPELDIERRTAADGNLLRVVADVRYDQHVVRRHVQRKAAVDTRTGTFGRTLHHNCSTDNRLAGCILHLALDRPGLLPGGFVLRVVFGDQIDFLIADLIADPGAGKEAVQRRFELRVRHVKRHDPVGINRRTRVVERIAGLPRNLVQHLHQLYLPEPDSHLLRRDRGHGRHQKNCRQ